MYGLRSKECLSEMPENLYGPYSVFISFIDMTGNDLEYLPDLVFQSFPNLIDLKLGHNFLHELPGKFIIYYPALL